MAPTPPEQKEHNDIPSALDVAIQDLNRAEETSCIPPAQVAFASVGDLLIMTGDQKDSTAREQDYVDIGLFCADICRTLDRGLNGRQLDGLSGSVRGAIEELTTTVANVQKKYIKQGKRNPVSRLFHTANEKDMITAWRRDLNRILRIFNTELLMTNHVMLLDLHRNVLADRESTDVRYQVVQTSIFDGELPPPPPGVCFGRDGLIEDIVGHAKSLSSIALVGPGGIGKTSIALAVLHSDWIKERFGANRRFIRCDQFPPSRANLLGRISTVIGAGIENPEDVTSLRPSLSSKEMIIILDNAESILDPQGADGRDIYRVVEELSRFDNICLVITSRITTTPPNCKTLQVPTLSMEAAHDTFYHICERGDRSDSVNDILRQLAFHPLSVTLLATVAHQNKWDDNRLCREWERRHTGVLQTEYNESLAAAVELSLTSPMFRRLGPSARELLGVIAFFPQGINEDNANWLLPTISDITIIFDKFCLLSLTHRSNGSITMLAPLRDYIRPKDFLSSPLLLATKESYFARMSVELDLRAPKTRELQWITSEDSNIEHLLDVFMSIDPNPDDAWRGCANFLYHLGWHRPRQTVLGPKIESLPEAHPSKPECLFWLGYLFGSLGNYLERKRLLDHALKLERERDNDSMVALILIFLCDANRMLGLRKEGMQQVKEALEISERTGDMASQGESLAIHAALLYADGQLDAAEEEVSRSIELIQEKGDEYLLCRSHRILGDVCRCKGEREKAIHHFEVALEIASPFDWDIQLFWIHFALAELFRGEGKLDCARAHIERAKSHSVNNAYCLARAVLLQAQVHCQQSRFEDATSESQYAFEIFEGLGATADMEDCKDLLRDIEQATEG